MMKRFQGVAVAGLLVSGCYPLEQSALVYSASHQIGVGVTAGTPDTPGLVVNIGYRSLNAAYVPVAVAKHCPVSAAHRCHDIAQELLALRARHNLGSELSTDARAIQNLELAIAQQVVQRDRLQASVESDERLLAQIGQADQRRAALETEQGELNQKPEPTPEEQQRLGQVTNDLQAIRALPQREVVNQRLETNRGQLRQVAAQMESDRARLGTLQQLRNSTRSDTTEDAYSVFGSFDGSATGNAEGAGIGVGQVFSTGVAAQHLTRGLQAAAVTTACLGVLDDLARTVAEANRQQFLQEGIAACRLDQAPPAGS